MSLDNPLWALPDFPGIGIRRPRLRFRTPYDIFFPVVPLGGVSEPILYLGIAAAFNMVADHMWEFSPERAERFEEMVVFLRVQPNRSGIPQAYLNRILGEWPTGDYDEGDEQEPLWVRWATWAVELLSEHGHGHPANEETRGGEVLMSAILSIATKKGLPWDALGGWLLALDSGPIIYFDASVQNAFAARDALNIYNEVADEWWDQLEIILPVRQGLRVELDE